MRTPFTPLASTSSSLDLKLSSWSVVTSAEAANWALAWSNVLDTSVWTGIREKTDLVVDRNCHMTFFF